jgi:hypothetical protein
MAQKTDTELHALKARAHAAQVTGAHLAHAETHIMALVDELLALRNGGKKIALKETFKPAAAKVLEAVKEVDMPMAVATTVEELATQLEADIKGEKDAHDLAVDKIEAETKAKKETKGKKGE